MINTPHIDAFLKGGPGSGIKGHKTASPMDSYKQIPKKNIDEVKSLIGKLEGKDKSRAQKTMNDFMETTQGKVEEGFEQRRFKAGVDSLKEYVASPDKRPILLTSFIGDIGALTAWREQAEREFGAKEAKKKLRSWK